MTLYPLIALFTVLHMCIFVHHPSPPPESKFHEGRDFILCTLYQAWYTLVTQKTSGEWKAGKKAGRKARREGGREGAGKKMYYPCSGWNILFSS